MKTKPLYAEFIFTSVILKNQKLQELEQYCLRDPLSHAFALWDLREEKSRTEFYVDWNDTVRGYMLIFHGSEVPSIIMHGEKESIKLFMSMISLEKAILHFPYQFCGMWKKGGEKYRIDVMAAVPFQHPPNKDVKIIRNPAALTSIFSNPDYLVNKAITFGLYDGKEVVSVASALVHLPEVWVMGAVYTKKEKRNRGLATKVVGHFMSEAYGKTEFVVLWVRSDNIPAIKIYRKYGFEKIGENCWVNIGVNVLP